MPELRRAHHRVIAGLLRRLNGKVLAEAECFFGGGTHLAMSFGEYRESRDIDFLCSSRTGYRILRETITEQSLGKLTRRPLTLAREVRADREGIRTFLDAEGARIKFEILFEARIDLVGRLDRDWGVPILDTGCAIAEKLLANADRGLDESTHFRDLIDLAFVSVHAEKHVFDQGLAIAEGAYGNAVLRHLRLVLDAFRSHRARASACLESLGIEDTATLRRGLRRLRAVVR